MEGVRRLLVFLAITYVNAEDAKTDGNSGNTRFHPGVGSNIGQFGRPTGQFGGATGQFGRPTGQFGSGTGQLGNFAGQLASPGFPQAVLPVNPGFSGVPVGHGNPQAGLVSPLRPDCKFYKRDQYGNWVCDVDQKPFQCPPVRLECPRFGIPVGPQACSNDNDCYQNDKCCRDICFPHLICKGPE